jgi:flagellar motility protein MotE (MotC chaperone)
MKFGNLFGRRKNAGSILLISSLLIGSAVLRVAAGAGQAVATESALEEASATSENSQSAGQEINRDQLSNMLQAFQEREKRIVENERKIEIRMKALTVADVEIERRLAVLKEAEDSLRSVLTMANTAAEDDLARLTSVYENMKPKDAAALFEEMEPAFAAGFLGRMRSETAAGIMAGLSPQVAYSISVILAGRNADVPKG